MISRVLNLLLVTVERKNIQQNKCVGSIKIKALSLDYTDLSSWELNDSNWFAVENITISIKLKGGVNAGNDQ